MPVAAKTTWQFLWYLSNKSNIWRRNVHQNSPFNSSSNILQTHASFQSLKGPDNTGQVDPKTRTDWNVLCNRAQSLCCWWLIRSIQNDAENLTEALTKTLAHGCSSESTLWELSNEYQHDSVKIFLFSFKLLCDLVLLTKVASALEVLTLILRVLLSSNAQKISSKPCHAGIHWMALTEYYQISTHVPWFQSFFRFFASFCIGKLGTSSMRFNFRGSTWKGWIVAQGRNISPWEEIHRWQGLGRSHPQRS